MKKVFTIFAMALGILLFAHPSTATAQSRFKPATHRVLPAQKNIYSSPSSSFTPIPLKANPRKEGRAEDILVDEDFSAFTAGSILQPDTTNELAYTNGGYIDSKLTKDGTWGGYGVYSAGGAIYMKTYNPQDPAFLLTPLGDYSGDVTITCKVKAMPDVIPLPDGGWAKQTGSSLYIFPCIHGYGVKDLAKTDDKEGGFYDVRLYENQGWTQVTYKIKNYSGNNDGFIEFMTEGAIIIDDVRVTTSPTFLASPAMNGIVDFQKDQFTISWQPLRKSFNYFLDLYKKSYTSDSEGVLDQDFENYTHRSEWQSNVLEATAGAGEDGSYGLVLKNGDTLTTPVTNPTYTEATFYMKVVAPSAQEYAGQRLVNGMVNIDVLTYEGWNSLGQFYCAAFEDGGFISMAEQLKKFPNSYNAFRIRPEGMDADEYVVLDNMEVRTNRPFDYELVQCDESIDYGGDYTLYDETYDTSYTFKNLDPESEYYYGVRGHYVQTFSPRILYHAMGVGTPEATPATNIDSRGAFTANWISVPKAQQYTVKLYQANDMKEDNANYTILSEDFSKVTSEVTSATDPSEMEMLEETRNEISLDDYTANPGWTGVGAAVVQGMLGAVGGGEITTPYLDLRNAEKFSLSVKAYGAAGDMFVIYDGVKGYGLTFDDNGVVDQTVDVPVGGTRTSLSLFSYTQQPFLIDDITLTQSVKAGQRVYTWLGDVQTGDVSYSFDNLTDYANSLLSYEVYSHFTLEGKTATSMKPSDMILVDLATRKSVSGIANLASDSNKAEVVARYNAAGQRISKPCKGVNILKMSDGRTVKIIL